MILPSPVRTLLRLAFLGLAVLPAQVLTAQWYESDESGADRRRIAESERGSYEHVLHVEQSAAVETRTLYAHGEPVGQIELEYDGDRLLTRRVSREGRVDVTEHYRYWTDGSLRSVLSVGERGSQVEYRYRDGRLHETWSYGTGVSERIRYDEIGRISDRTRWEGDDVAERETREYRGPSAGDPLSRVVLVSQGRETVSRYDEEGRLLGATVLHDGGTESERQLVYEDGLLVEEREQRGAILRVVRFEYEDRFLVRERHVENEALLRVVEYHEGDYTRVETLYRGDEPTLRVVYHGEDRLREEVFRDGVVIRTRVYATAGEQP